MVRKISILILILTACFLASSCSNDAKLVENEAFKKIMSDSEIGDDVIGVIFNDLSPDMMSKYTEGISLEKSSYDDFTLDSVLVVPRYNDMIIRVYDYEYDSKSNQFINREIQYETTQKENYAFLYQYPRPEGLPTLLNIEGIGESVDILYYDDLKDGNKSIEYIYKDK